MTDKQKDLVADIVNKFAEKEEEPTIDFSNWSLEDDEKYQQTGQVPEQVQIDAKVDEGVKK